MQSKETISTEESWDWGSSLNDDNDTCGCYEDDY